jgi:hypothetical protein
LATETKDNLYPPGIPANLFYFADPYIGFLKILCLDEKGLISAGLPATFA